MAFLEKLMSILSGRVDFSKSDSELFNSVLSRIEKLEPSRPEQHEPSMKLIQEDLILGDLGPIALAIIAIRRSTDSPDYIVGKEFQDMCMYASQCMADTHSRASSAFTKMMPKLPGLTTTAGHQGSEALNLSLQKISEVLSQISSNGLLLPADTAISNLQRVIARKLKITANDAVKLYESV